MHLDLVAMACLPLSGISNLVFFSRHHGAAQLVGVVFVCVPRPIGEAGARRYFRTLYLCHHRLMVNYGVVVLAILSGWIIFECDVARFDDDALVATTAAGLIVASLHKHPVHHVVYVSAIQLFQSRRVVDVVVQVLGRPIPRAGTDVAGPAAVYDDVGVHFAADPSHVIPRVCRVILVLVVGIGFDRHDRLQQVQLELVPGGGKVHAVTPAEGLGL